MGDIYNRSREKKRSTEMSRIKKEITESPFKGMIQRTDIFSDVMLGNLLGRNRVYKE